MGVEIERKFLVDDESWRGDVTKSIEIRQGYLELRENFSIRLRIIDRAEANITIKSAWRDRRRDEFEYAIPALDAERMLAWRTGSIIEKTRHLVPAGDLTWEIDVFSGDNAGLIIAEVELRHEDQTVALPSWVGAEVTSDQRYHNATLALRPFKDWTSADTAADFDRAALKASVSGD